MRAALLMTVSDFPARSSLSGLSGQGYYACPSCNDATPSMRIKNKISHVDIDLSGVLRGVLHRDAERCYRGWKNELATHFKEYDSLEQVLAKAPESIRDPEQWHKCCARFDSNEFKNNRAENTIPSHHGQKSYAQYLAEKADPMTNEPYSEIENWKDMRMREGKWNNQQAEQRYDMMNVERTTQIAQAGSADERTILKQSHPPHRGHHVGVGPTLPYF